MIAVSVSASGVRNNISLTKTPKLGYALILGEIGRGRWQETVKLDTRFPPKIEEVDGSEQAALSSCNIVGFTAAGRQRFAFTEAGPDDKGLLVHVNTHGEYMKNQPGFVLPHFGTPSLVVSGFGANGEAGTLSKWEDTVWRMNDGEAVFVKQSGDAQTNPAVVYYNEGGVLAAYAPEAFKFVMDAWLLSATPTDVQKEIKNAELRKDIKTAEYLRSNLQN